MSDLADIDVQVLQDRDLVVTWPATGEQVTCRKDGASPVLVLMDSMQMDPDPERARFRHGGPLMPRLSSSGG